MRANHRILLAFGTPVIVAVISVVIASSALIMTHPEVARGITYDLTILSPLLYFLLIRKTNVPNITVIPVFVLGLLLAYQIIPVSNRSDLQMISTFVLPAVELAVITIILLKVGEAVKKYRATDQSSGDMVEILRKTSASVVQNKIVANVLAMELCSIYYSLINWKKPPVQGFSYHRNSGSLAILVALVFLLIVETLVLHILLTRWSSTAAWILTGISIYSAIQIIGHIKSMMQRPIVISGDSIFLKYGLFGDVTIEKSNIVSIGLTEKNAESGNKSNSVQKLSLLANMEPHNIIIRLHAPVTVSKAYGIQKSADTILFYIDHPEDFKRTIET